MKNREIFAIVFTVLALLAIGGYTVYRMGSSWPERGTIGDSFGMTNALFSGLAFAGVVYAILLQRQELSLQREELKLTREELSKSAKAQSESAETQKQHAQLNAYTSLMTYKLAELKEALDNATSRADTPDFRLHWAKRHQEVRMECVRLEASIENILFKVGGRIEVVERKSLEEVVAAMYDDKSDSSANNKNQG